MGAFAGIKNFVIEKFWVPVTDQTVFYNPFNTAVYAALFAAAAAYLGWPTLKKLNITLNREFFIGIAPYAFVGGALRSLEDIGVVGPPLFVTPFIYVVIFGLIAGMIWVSLQVARRTEVEYHRFLAGSGILILLALLSFHSPNNASAVVEFFFVMAAWAVPGYFLLNLFKPELATYSFGIPVAAHLYDATTTYVALGYGAQEKHVLADFFIQSMGPTGMFVMKSLIVIPAVYYINENVEGQEKLYYLFLISILGIGIATRNILSLVTLG